MNDQETRMIEALKACREKFAYYAVSHHAKNTPDATAKAIVNEQMVAMITDVLGDA